MRIWISEIESLFERLFCVSFFSNFSIDFVIDGPRFRKFIFWMYQCQGPTNMFANIEHLCSLFLGHLKVRWSNVRQFSILWKLEFWTLCSWILFSNLYSRVPMPMINEHSNIEQKCWPMTNAFNIEREVKCTLGHLSYVWTYVRWGPICILWEKSAYHV